MEGQKKRLVLTFPNWLKDGMQTKENLDSTKKLD
jgi:hypothetical protein